MTKDGKQWKPPRIIIPRIHESDEPIIKIFEKDKPPEPLIKTGESKKCITFKKDDAEFTVCNALPKHMEHMLINIMGWQKIEKDNNR